MLIAIKILSWIFISFKYFSLVHFVLGNVSYDVVQQVDRNIPHLFGSSSTFNLSKTANELNSNQTTQSKWRYLCPYMRHKCNELPGYCLTCNFSTSCVYGTVVNVTCFPRPGVYCKYPGDTNQQNSVFQTNLSEILYPLSDRTNYPIQKQVICRFCHQLDDSEIVCIGRTDCHQPNVARSFYETKCEPFPHVLCLGRRVFRRMVPCEWSTGKSYALTVVLSLFFGGFGVDRFYLGMWIEGLGKLFSFGGLGLWSIVDFILIVSGYVKPPGDAVYW
ncbi:TM2 domain-containing protein isoform 1 [Schistosoma japonicum]|uniref:TM2 domain-containing protein isoform 1 n=2 Tax=Schistosoma japonicum TaxID=6182 RepID=A0A4Z2CPX9_SCHJA|nr:TM2 domain-containing protein isoform 1 [Schistosoma japonicum]